MHIINGFKISGIASRFPQKIAKTDDYAYFTKDEAQKFKENVGIHERRIVEGGTCASDLCEAATRDLMSGLGWSGGDVDAFIMITQTGDFPVPATSIILQNKLSIKKEAICFDINLGCSSFPYGLYVVGALLRAGGLRRAILSIGDVSSKVCSYADKSSYPLFGDAGTAIALEVNDKNSKFVFDLMTDGSGYKAIIIESGGLASRNPSRVESLTDIEVSPGIRRNELNLVLKGADIFSFAISKVPHSILEVSRAIGAEVSQCDYLVLHQANKLINNQIVRKVKVDPARSLSTLEKFGNTSSASIPLTITAHADLFRGKARSIIASGFGVGLSWGTVAFDLMTDVYYSHKEY
jgi:3-oxoacyl-[acyl-carrier-protein] synthase-3